MNTEIYLIRHGETAWNKEGRFQGCTDIPLSQEGMLQAKFLKTRFNNEFDFLYTSPLSRASETARIISEGSTIEPIILDEIIEINFGKWEGLSLKEIEEQYPLEFYNWKNDEETANLVGGEVSLKAASIRAKNAVLTLVRQHKGQRILIVAHGGIIKASLVGLMDWKMTMYQKLLFGNTSVSKLSFDEYLNPLIITINDTSHLPTNYQLKSFV